MAQQLFAAIRRGKVKPGMGAEFAMRVQAGARPVMKQMDGFKGYYLVLTPDDTVMAVSLFTNKTVAETSTRKLLPSRKTSARCWPHRRKRRTGRS